jgi:hypothetical protein
MLVFLYKIGKKIIKFGICPTINKPNMGKYQILGFVLTKVTKKSQNHM